MAKECLETIKKSCEKGEPKNFCFVHSYAGDHEEVVSDFIPTLEQAVDEYISTLNNNEWDEDSYYFSIEGNWRKDAKEEDDEIGTLDTIYVEELNDAED